MSNNNDVGWGTDPADVAAPADEPPKLEQRGERIDRRQAATSTPVMERRVRQRRKPTLLLDENADQFDDVAFGVALRVTGNRQAAADITQGFLAIWERQQYAAPAKPSSLRSRFADRLEGTGPSSENYELTGWLPVGELASKSRRADPDHPTVTVVIPTMNEAKNLPQVFERLPDWIDEVIVVDGHSTDDTVAVARTCRPDVKIVIQTGKGKGNALACGFKAATGDITVMLDADGSTDPAEIPRFVAALTNGFDFAKGTRFVTGGGSDDITVLRRIGNWGITTLVNRIWGSRYSDLCYGYNAFWTKSLPPSFADCNGFEVETLMNIRLAASDIKVVEVPSFEANRVHGTSNLQVGRDGRRVLRTILAEWIRPG